jgi:hypothetical protein
LVQFDKAFFMKLCWACLFKSGVYMPKVRLIPFKSAQVRSNPYAIRQRIGTASRQLRLGFDWASRKIRVRFETASAGLRERFGSASARSRTTAEQQAKQSRPCSGHVPKLPRTKANDVPTKAQSTLSMRKT